MTSASRYKLYQAGYIFFRAIWDSSARQGRITYSTSHGSWRLYVGGYKTKADMRRAMDELIARDPITLEDSSYGAEQELNDAAAEDSIIPPAHGGQTLFD